MRAVQAFSRYTKHLARTTCVASAYKAFPIGLAAAESRELGVAVRLHSRLARPRRAGCRCAREPLHAQAHAHKGMQCAAARAQVCWQPHLLRAHCSAFRLPLPLRHSPRAVKAMAIQEYIDQHDLQKKVEQLINTCVQKKPDDPLAFMANELRNMTSPEITDVKGRMIIDSRGNPTVEADVHTHKGFFRAAVPSGASTGVHEAVELRDGDKSVFMGKGVSKAVDNINTIIAPALKGRNPIEQADIDNYMIKELDGTKNKGKLGANAILAVSLAVCKAGAAEKGIPLWKHIAELAGNPKPQLPVPSFNIINGGSHAGNSLAMQEFMILPVGAASFSEAMRMGCEVYHNLKALIKKKYGQDACNVGDEGGFAPNISSNDEGLNLVNQAIAQAGYEGKVKIGMDVAASEFYTEDKMYDLDFKTENNDGSQKKTAAQMTEMYKSFCKNFPVVSIEDPFDQARSSLRATPHTRRAFLCAVLVLRARTAALGDTSANYDNLPTAAPRAGRLGGLHAAQRGGRGADRGRRPPRHQPRARADRDRQKGVQRAPPQGQPDRLRHRVHHGRQDVQGRRLGRHGVAPQRRDGGLLHRGPRGGPEHGPDQDGRAVPQRAPRQVQPAAAHRGGARRGRGVHGRGLPPRVVERVGACRVRRRRSGCA